MGNFVYEVHKKAVQVWVKEVNPVAQFSVGDAVWYAYNGFWNAPKPYFVNDIRHTTAEYLLVESYDIFAHRHTSKNGDIFRLGMIVPYEEVF